MPEHGPEPPECEFPNFEISNHDVFHQLSILGTSKPCGPDGISPRILMETRYFLLKPLCKLFNMSLRIKPFHIYGNNHILHLSLRNAAT